LKAALGPFGAPRTGDVEARAQLCDDAKKFFAKRELCRL